MYYSNLKKDSKLGWILKEISTITMQEDLDYLCKLFMKNFEMINYCYNSSLLSIETYGKIVVNIDFSKIKEIAWFIEHIPKDVHTKVMYKYLMKYYVEESKKNQIFINQELFEETNAEIFT